MKEHLLTKVNNRLLRQIQLTDRKLKEMGKVPYMAREATPKEQIEAFQGLTEEQLYDLIRRYGEEAVNRYLERMNRRTDNGRRID